MDPDKYGCADNRLFTDGLASENWVTFDATGLSVPVSGITFRSDNPTTKGMPLGGVDTGCLDFETSGLWRYSAIFNSHVPRCDPMNLPFLGPNVGEET